MTSVMIDTGNYIAAKAAIMAKPEVVAAYPITPQTTLVEGIAKYLATGEYKGEYIVINSEKFYGSDTLFTPIIKKIKLNPISYKKIDKNYLFCYYTNDLVYFYYIN